MEYLEEYRKWRDSAFLSDSERDELDRMREDESQVQECFGAELEFGTAGMRGLLGMGTNRMNRFMVMKATYGLSRYILSEDGNAAERGVVISYDTRHQSRFFAEVSAEVLTAGGIRCYLFNECRPVPMLSFAVRHFQAVCGIMITASHNPKEYNGYKVYGADGAQMGPEETERVVSAMKEVQDPSAVELAGLSSNPLVAEVGKELDDAYYAAILPLVLASKEIAEYRDKVKMVYTPLHGSGFKPVTGVLDRLGISYTLVEEQTVYDPNFSTVEVPNPEYRETLTLGIRKADEIGADVVFGTDPDCDRLGVAVRSDAGAFEVLTGNQVGVLLLDYILSKLAAEKKLPKNGAVVKSIVTSEMARPICDAYGVTLFDVLVGFKFIGEKIKEFERDGSFTYLFGFEESCGYLRGTHARDKDAVTACMLVSEMVCYYESLGTGLYARLNELYRKYGYYLDSNFSITYPGLSGMRKMTDMMEKLRGEAVAEIGGVKVTAVRDYQSRLRTDLSGKTTPILLPQANVLYFELENGGRVCMRPSGTEPKLKVYLCVKAAKRAEAETVLERAAADARALLS